MYSVKQTLQEHYIYIPPSTCTSYSRSLRNVIYKNYHKWLLTAHCNMYILLANWDNPQERIRVVCMGLYAPPTLRNSHTNVNRYKVISTNLRVLTNITLIYLCLRSIPFHGVLKLYYLSEEDPEIPIHGSRPNPSIFSKSCISPWPWLTNQNVRPECSMQSRVYVRKTDKSNIKKYILDKIGYVF